MDLLISQVILEVMSVPGIALCLIIIHLAGKQRAGFCDAKAGSQQAFTWSNER